MAPVNAPFSWPNSVLSTSSFGMAARLTATNGASAMPDSRWISRASSSLPVPLSPRIRTVAESFATFWTSSRISRVRAARPDDELAVGLLGDLGAQPQDVPVEVLPLAGVGHERPHALEVEVLRDVVIRAVAHRLDRRVELLQRRDDDDFDVGVVLLDDLEDFEAADARQADVEQHQVDVLLLHHLEGRFAGGGAQHAVVALEHRRQRLAHPLVVVDDEDGFPAFGHAGREYRSPGQVRDS